MIVTFALAMSLLSAGFAVGALIPQKAKIQVRKEVDPYRPW
jgi:hypothetical protein